MDSGPPRLVGEGVVVRVEDGDKLTVLFDDVGYKTLSPELVEDTGLLQARDREGIDR